MLLDYFFAGEVEKRLQGVVILSQSVITERRYARLVSRLASALRG
jgi:hypothetical protein